MGALPPTSSPPASIPGRSQISRRLRHASMASRFRTPPPRTRRFIIELNFYFSRISTGSSRLVAGRCCCALARRMHAAIKMISFIFRGAFISRGYAVLSLTPLFYFETKFLHAPFTRAVYFEASRFTPRRLRHWLRAGRHEKAGRNVSGASISCRELPPPPLRLSSRLACRHTSRAADSDMRRCSPPAEHTPSFKAAIFHT